MADCIFCKIVAGSVPCRAVYDTDTIIAFHDMHPKAPVHVLVVPKQHIATMNEFPVDGALAADMMRAVKHIAREQGIAERGYRLIVNTNRDGGQEVYHVHWHLLGGRTIGPMITRPGPV